MSTSFLEKLSRCMSDEEYSNVNYHILMGIIDTYIFTLDDQSKHEHTTQASNDLRKCLTNMKNDGVDPNAVGICTDDYYNSQKSVLLDNIRCDLSIYYDVVHILLDLGADPNLEISNGCQTSGPIQELIIALRGHVSTKSYQTYLDNSINMLQLLIEYNVNLNPERILDEQNKNKYGLNKYYTPLESVCKFIPGEALSHMVEMLINSGADPTFGTNRCVSIILERVKSKKLPVDNVVVYTIKLLVENGALLDRKLLTSEIRKLI